MPLRNPCFCMLGRIENGASSHVGLHCLLRGIYLVTFAQPPPCPSLLWWKWICPGIVDSQLSYKFELIDLVWGPIPQRRVNPFTVVEPLKVVKNALPCLSPGLVLVMKDHRSFQ